jgi:pilus assembly protein CpaB
VDVVVILGKNEVTGEPISRAVVGNVQVLTAGTRFDQEQAKAEGKPIPSTVVTLLVTPEDAERISLAANQGQITLTLRNPLDVAPTATSGVRMANLLGAPAAPVTIKNVEGRRVVKRPPPPPAAPAAAPVAKTYTVEAIRGAKRTEEPVK